ncbi:MAG: hypothetical protein VB071_15210 [Lawsonibacter sp.]|nr:hypothetical protein [Lawsonibacter sp.]
MRPALPFNSSLVFTPYVKTHYDFKDKNPFIYPPEKHQNAKVSTIAPAIPSKIIFRHPSHVPHKKMQENPLLMNFHALDGHEEDRILFQ